MSFGDDFNTSYQNTACFTFFTFREEKAYGNAVRHLISGVIKSSKKVVCGK